MGAYTSDWLTTPEADALQAFCDTLVYKPYTFARTGQPLLRSPGRVTLLPERPAAKCEFAMGPTLVYRWGQSVSTQGVPAQT